MVVVIALLVAGCSADSSGSTGSPTTESAPEPTVLGTTTVTTVVTTSTEAPPPLSGTLRVTGSSTVEGITRAVTAGYADRQPDVDVAIDAVGTGAGFDDLCTDPGVSLIGASRPINGQESATCLANGVQPVELRLARDGIAVVANNASTLQCLTYEDLYALTGPESTGLSDATAIGAFAAELGSTTPWGEGAVTVVAPGDIHGTHQLFVEFVIEPIAAERNVGVFLRVDNRSLDSNAQLVQAVAADPSAIGIVGSAYAVKNSPLVKLLGVSDGSGCVVPNDAAVVQGIYPMSRDLYLYADGASDDPILDDFVTYYLDVALADAVSQAEYVVLSPAEQTQTSARWSNR